MSIDLQAANLRSNKHKCLQSVKIVTFNCRTLKSHYRVLELIELVRKKCIDVLAIQEHRRTKTALVTDINIPTGYRLFMNDTHSPGIGGIGFVISPRCSYKLISSELFPTRIGKLVFDISRRRIHILSIYARPQSMHIRMKQCLYMTLSSIVDAIPTRDHLFICGDFNATLPVNKTDAVKLIVTLRCSNPLLRIMTCLLPMHTQGKNTAHFRPLMDQMGKRYSLIGFSALFVIDATSGNPIHLRHL